MAQKLVCIGNGLVGTRALEELFQRCPDAYEVTVFGAEPHLPYNRIALSSVLAGEKTVPEITICNPEWYATHSVNFHAGTRVVQIDRKTQVVTAEDGTSASYDRLLLATGSDPFMLPLPGRDLPGVVTFRDIGDVEQMMKASEHYQRAVVIGGGLLGLEAAHGLRERGMKVTVVHLMDSLMERQLDPDASKMLQDELEERGFEFRMEASTKEIFGEKRVAGIRLADGEEIAADLVVVAVGIRPNIELGRSADLECGRGVIVNDVLQTSDPNIYAVGECAQHRGRTYGLVAPLYEMCSVWARHMAAEDNATYSGSTESTRLKVAGVDLFSGGNFIGGDDCECLRMSDQGKRRYKKLLIKDQCLQGVVLYGDTRDAAWYAQLMRENTNVSDFRDDLLLGHAYHQSQISSAPVKLSAMRDDAEVCGCNGVCKGSIVGTIKKRRLTTLAEVRAHTKASASCGSCTPLVQELLADTLGTDYQSETADPPLCPCTTHSHDEVRETIRSEQLRSIDQVMLKLNWSTSDGCHKCRPALNYYLLTAWPGEYRDDAQSRFVNERVHANIQKDGTFSVIPRIWGGVSSAKELRAIADVAEKYNVPTVKITGGQRLDLLGIKKEDLPAVWKDLNDAGMVSGHAYGKAIRTVKTCVGSEWCRMGVQDSTTMGQRLERMSWGAWGPHKMKLGVSGCPRNCAEATIKDFGVVAVESGWELHVGGNGGIKVRAADFLCKVETPDQVLEYCGAFLQLYREEGRYGTERTAHFIERVGLDYVKRRIVQDELGRETLHERFLQSQKHLQGDPWAKHSTTGTKGFRRLKILTSNNKHSAA